MKADKEITLRLYRVDIPGKCSGMCAEDSSGDYMIIINNKLSAEDQMRTLLHEMMHIYNDDFARVEAEGVQAVEDRMHEQIDRLLLPLPF